jgi:phosphocarrier protein HPr
LSENGQNSRVLVLTDRLASSLRRGQRIVGELQIMKLVEQFFGSMAWFLWGPRERTQSDGAQRKDPMMMNTSSTMNYMGTMPPPPKRYAIGTYLRVTHTHGVTLRMAGEIVRAVQPLNVKITLIYKGVVADADSILSIAALAAGYGAKVYVWANGPDTTQAIEILAKVFAGGFGMKDTTT